MALCPECESEVDLDPLDVEIGDELSCAECSTLLRVANDHPVEFEAVDDLDEDDVDEEDDEDDDEEDEDADEAWDEKED